MNYDIFLSIIISAYNAEHTIDRCLKSIINQKYDNYELIIVNDGSIDNTLQVLKKYEEEYHFLKIINKQNGGASSARNAGLKNSRGKYVIFVDSDDYLYDGSLLKRLLDASDCDMLISSYSILTNTINNHYNGGNYFIQKNEMIRQLFSSEKIGYQGYLWNKVFDNKIIKDNNIFFDEKIKYNEDRLFVLMYLLCIDSIKVSNDLVYVYCKNDESMMNRIKKANDCDCNDIMTEFIAFEKMLNLLKERRNDTYYVCLKACFYRALAIKKILPKSSKKIIKCINKNIIKYGNSIIVSPNDSIKLLLKFKCLIHMIFLV